MATTLPSPTYWMVSDHRCFRRGGKWTTPPLPTSLYMYIQQPETRRESSRTTRCYRPTNKSGSGVRSRVASIPCCSGVGVTRSSCPRGSQTASGNLGPLGSNGSGSAAARAADHHKYRKQHPGKPCVPGATESASATGFLVVGWSLRTTGGSRALADAARIAGLSA